MPASDGIRGLVFDLDGTLVDSGLDFPAIRREMQLPDEMTILEALERLPEPRASRCRQILAEHEWAGARRARIMPGVEALLEVLAARGIHRAILTRNARDVALATIERLGLDFELLIAREDAPAKPDPAALIGLASRWQLSPRQLAIVGDYRYDIEAGRSAGIWTVLYTGGRDRSELADWAPPDYWLDCFTQCEGFLRWLDQPT